MGWKTVRDHYKIGHMVHIRDGKLMIGSQLCSDLIQFDAATGKFLKYALGSSIEAKDCFPWSQRILADSKSGELAKLIAETDKIGETVPVYCHDYYQIIEKRAEPPVEYGNCCTDGELIYENTHWTSREDAEQDLLITSLHHEASNVEAMDEMIERMATRRLYAARAFKGLVNSLGLSKKFSFELMEIDLRWKRICQR